MRLRDMIYSGYKLSEDRYREAHISQTAEAAEGSLLSYYSDVKGDQSGQHGTSWILLDRL